MVPLYNVLETNHIENTIFNNQLLYICINIKYTFEISKGRWKSLTSLRLILIFEKKYKFVYIWITYYIILHNILIDIYNE